MADCELAKQERNFWVSKNAPLLQMVTPRPLPRLSSQQQSNMKQMGKTGWAPGFTGHPLFMDWTCRRTSALGALDLWIQDTKSDPRHRSELVGPLLSWARLEGVSVEAEKVEQNHRMIEAKEPHGTFTQTSSF